ncbi:MAG: UTP--glucose-1-phosphate uridylyltransferase [Planctomycetota bacterium]
MQELRARFEAAGQGHLFQGLETLSPGDQDRFWSQLSQVDLDLVALHASLLKQSAAASAPGRFEPPDTFPASPGPEQAPAAEAALETGAELLRAGKVGYVLVAGGQGSRLGFDGPKGIYPVGPLSRKSLFGWHAARLKAAAARYGCPVPWFIMTSAGNDAATREFFARQQHFGLPPDSIFFFEQAVIPALDGDGRIVRAAPGELFLAPNGHGGTLDALRRSGALDRCQALGIETLSYFQVDNPLARPADPLFLGLHKQSGAGMSSKVVAKTEPGEKVGVLGKVDGVLGCIEYSDLPADLRDARAGDGGLVFRAGNIAVHALQVDFVARLTESGLNLPWHLARKAMPGLDAAGQPSTVQGIKFETFIFDALAASPGSVTLEVRREEEFSPVKNAEGSDSPASCREHMTGLFASWADAAGFPQVPRDAAGVPLLEVDPVFAEDAAEFQARMPQDPIVHGGGWWFR